MGSTARAFAALGLAATAVTAYAAWRADPARLGAVGISPAALHLVSTPARPPEATESVSVLIPVRHAPDPAMAAVRAALCQQGVETLDIVVLDDGCPQETRTVLRREFGDDPRVRILAAAPLPRGWSPLAHRSHQLAVAARGRVLIFAEPCSPLGPNAAAAATALLRTEKLDLAVLDTGWPATTGQPAEQTQQTDMDLDMAEVHAGLRHAAQPMQTAKDARAAKSAQPGQMRNRAGRHHSTRIHPGRFTVAVDAAAYWRIGGYRAAAADPDPLALLRTVRRASGRAIVADGRRVIPPALPLAPLAPPVPQAEAEAHWDSMHNTRGSLTDTARRVLAALVGARA
ncbi:MAG: glycosyltransferase [Actinocrinis sp.]